MKFLIFLFLIGCSSNQYALQDLSPANKYKRDMLITYEGKTYEGTLVVPFKKKYDFHIEAKGNLDLFTMTTCHKEETKEKAWNVTKAVKRGLLGWGKKKITAKKEVKFTYYPTPSLEDDGDCLMELGGYEIDKGRHSWAIIDFENKQYDLPARVVCNGRSYQSKGTTVCQARKGLYQKIIFPTKVLVTPNKECALPISEGKIFEFEIRRGKCSFIFQEWKGAKRKHKLTTFGYEKILIRGI